MMARYLLCTLFIAFSALHISAQNLMHYATNSNGEIQVSLFPEKDGLTQFVYSVETILPPDDILNEAEDVIRNLSSIQNFEIENVSIGRNSLSYDIEMNYGSQPWGFSIWGSPVFMFNRKASIVKLKCDIYARKGTYAFKLYRFETNRNTIRGNAKNDGDPNIIQWQRVNSLLKERDEEIRECRKSIRKAKLVAFEYNYKIAYECNLYVQERNLLQLLIDNLKNVCNLGNDFGEIIPLSKQYVFCFDINDLASTNKFTDLADCFILIDKDIVCEQSSKDSSKRIYVTCGGESHEVAGKNEIIKNLIVDKLGYITFNESDADYIINYTVDTSGKDKAIVTVKDKSGNIIGTKKKGSSESDYENREVAESLYKSFISKILNDE